MFKTAKTQILGYSNNSSDFKKSASVSKIASFYEEHPVSSTSIAERLEMVAESYNISKDPKDYIYVAVRALTADVPNENWDAFAEKELLRFASEHSCKVYQTFNLKPHHVNHRSQNPMQARGAILDVYYNTKNDEHFPELLIGVDKTKDKRLAEGIASGEINGFSMGCDAESTICNVCGHKANSPYQFCSHIRSSKGKEFEGKVAFEWCEGVTFMEESSVDDPADKNAITQEVILASKNKMEVESEFLAINSKLNKILTNIEGDNNMRKAANIEAQEAEDASIKKDIPVETKGKGKEVEIKGKPPEKGKEKEEPKGKEKMDFKKLKEKEKKSELSSDEFGGVGATEKLPDRATVAGKENPYAKLHAERKEAVDEPAKKIWKNYVKDYGDDLTKDVKPKKIGETSKEADSGQKFIKLDNSSGNPPAKFKIDKANGNPPAKFKFAKIYKDVEAFPTQKFLVIAKNRVPIYLVDIVMCDGKVASKENIALFAKFTLRSVAEKGLATTMKEYKAKRLFSMYDTKYEPTMIKEFAGDIRDPKKHRDRPAKGVEESGTGDLSKVDRSKVREKEIYGDGQKDMKMKGSKKAQELSPLIDMIEAEEVKGTKPEDIKKIIDAWFDGKGGGPTAYARKKAGVTDRAVRDFSDKFQPEQKKGLLAEGEGDLKKVNRGTTQADEIYAKGSDDLDIKRDNVVDLKASKNPYIEARKEKKTKVPEKWKFGSIELEVDTNKKAALEKEYGRLVAESEKEFTAFKNMFKKRFSRALELATKRANLNLIDNDLKIAFGDVLTTPNEDYIGMDSQLAMDLIERAFSEGGNKFVASLIKEAEKYLEIPEDSFLAFEEDTNTLNLVLPVAEQSPVVEPPMAPIDEGEELVEVASRSNPVFTPKDGSIHKWDHLKGALRERLS